MQVFLHFLFAYVKKKLYLCTHMKNIFILLLAALTITACEKQTASTAQEAVPTPSHIDTYFNFHSDFVPARAIRVYIPENYDASKQYDVLYMHDGTMLYDASYTWNHQEWGVDEAMDSLIALGYIRPTIVVGIDNLPSTYSRVAEYCPDDVQQLLPEGKQLYGGLGTPNGNNYLRFLVEEVKPFIDSVYSTYPEREHTWIMGSSCGGLISSYALCKYPQVFAGAACMSTHSTLTADPEHPDPDAITAYREYLRTHLPAPNSCLLYFDRGDQTLDANYAESQAAINAMLEAEGWDSDHFLYRFFPGHAHDENSWRSRLDIPLRFLLKR